jgi:hypothetical protein
LFSMDCYVNIVYMPKEVSRLWAIFTTYEKSYDLIMTKMGWATFLAHFCHQRIWSPSWHTSLPSLVQRCNFLKWRRGYAQNIFCVALQRPLSTL